MLVKGMSLPVGEVVPSVPAPHAGCGQDNGPSPASLFPPNDGIQVAWSLCQP